MKRRMFEAMADHSANENVPLPIARFASRSGRSLAVLLEIQDDREDGIRVSDEQFRQMLTSTYCSGTIH